jgi:hypothetical protein
LFFYFAFGKKKGNETKGEPPFGDLREKVVVSSFVFAIGKRKSPPKVE